MTLYTNNTRTRAIVTLQISGLDNPEQALAIGSPATLRRFGAGLGITDWEVAAGERLVLLQGTQAEVLAVRNAS